MDWTQTTNTIDYGIKEVVSEGNKTTVSLERVGLMPMPIDINVTYEDGSTGNFYIPLQMMRADKPNPNPNQDWIVLQDWAWANPAYKFAINNGKTVKSISIDTSKLMADINLDNNTFQVK